MQLPIRRWYKEYKAVSKEKRALIRQTILILVFFVILGIVGSLLYRTQFDQDSLVGAQQNVADFFEQFTK